MVLWFLMAFEKFLRFYGLGFLDGSEHLKAVSDLQGTQTP